MSRRANAWDNAPMESCFKTLKVERIYQNHYETRAHASLSESLCVRHKLTAKEPLEFRIFLFELLHSAQFRRGQPTIFGSPVAAERLFAAPSYDTPPRPVCPVPPA